MSIPITTPLTYTILPVKTSGPKGAKNQAFLTTDTWDDWGEYRTQFFLTIADADGETHSIGTVKIGKFDLQPHVGGKDLPADHRIPRPPNSFTDLDDQFFSLGQSASYYEELNKFAPDVRAGIFKSLHDLAADEELWKRAKLEKVVRKSLTRGISETEVEGQFRAMTQGRARLTKFSFSFTPNADGDQGLPYCLQFDVRPNVKPPSNVHVIIGKNGVGKTYLLNSLLEAALTKAETTELNGRFKWSQLHDENIDFANVVNVSFSPFDNSLWPKGLPKSMGRTYSYVGLKRLLSLVKPGRAEMKSAKELAGRFAASVSNCVVGDKRRRWKEALDVLHTDEGLKEKGIDRFLEPGFIQDIRREDLAREIFDSLSSGHKIVLLAITQLVDKVEEKTLVLIDEPEAHLHPPLLSCFIRALSHLLADRNGVAIVATHSPVVLQEVPRECVWILSRFGSVAKAERPSLETFGENVGTLTQEVFRLELPRSGFYRMLEQVANEKPNFEQAVEAFEGKLGSEALAVLRALYLKKEFAANN